MVTKDPAAAWPHGRGRRAVDVRLRPRQAGPVIAQTGGSNADRGDLRGQKHAHGAAVEVQPGKGTVGLPSRAELANARFVSAIGFLVGGGALCFASIWAWEAKFNRNF